MSNKTAIIFGAGATTSCGMPITSKQESIFKEFFFGTENSFCSYIKKDISILKDKNTDIQILSDMRYEPEIRNLIDFVRDTFSRDSFTLLSFYNLVDMAISERRGFTTEKKNYTVEEISHFRASILELLQVLFSILEKNILHENPADYQKLKLFFKEIAEHKLKKHLEQGKNKNCDLQSKEFIFTDVSYISLNWDILILWAMMTAHKELNNSNRNYLAEKNGIVKLKVFNDFFTYLNSYDTSESESNKDWFPYNQTIAYRLNDADHISDRKIILFPTYLPHGQTHWLECPVCGKLTMYIDKKFRQYSENLIMEKHKNYRCANCDNKELNLKNSAMLLQTNYKIKAPYIEEIQRAMRIALNQADKLIAIGYSLPDDDIEYKSLFRISRKDKKKIYLILYSENALNQFLSSTEARRFCKGNDNEKAIKRYCDIFGEENVFVNLSGFPNAYDTIMDILL